MFDRIVCLLLDKRYNEKDRLTKEFSDVGLKLEFFLAGDGTSFPAEQYNHIDIVPPDNRTGYPAWANRPNSYNAFCCYKKIIQKAKDDGLSNVSLVEDDCTILPYFGHYLPSVKDELEKLPKWDMMYWCACHAWKKTRLLSEHILKLNGSGGFQFVTIKNTLFDVFLNMPMNNPIDGMAGDYVHANHNCYAVWPNLAIPKPGYSHCEGYSYDNTDKYNIRGC